MAAHAIAILIHVFMFQIILPTGGVLAAGTTDTPAAKSIVSNRRYLQIIDNDIAAQISWMHGTAKPSDGAPRRAAELLDDSVIEYHAYESWTGAMLTSAGWALYSGLSWAPFGNDGVQRDGWRVRLAGSHTRYQYRGSRWTGSANESVTFHGIGSNLDIFIGYHKQLGDVILKGFIGASWGSDAISPLDPGNSIQGETVGAKATLESWINVTPDLWLSMDLTLAQSHRSFGGNARLGYRITPSISVGPELARYGNKEGTGNRAGGFTRYEWDSGELSASAGIAGDLWLGQGAANSTRNIAYGSINWVRRF